MTKYEGEGAAKPPLPSHECLPLPLETLLRGSVVMQGEGRVGVEIAPDRTTHRGSGGIALRSRSAAA